MALNHMDILQLTKWPSCNYLKALIQTSPTDNLLPPLFPVEKYVLYYLLC